MNIAVLGGTGRTGEHVVEEALAHGHQVKVLARTPSKMKIKDPNLDIIKGNALNLDDIKLCFAGVDAVISVMGPTKNTPDDLMVNASANIVKAMQHHKIERIIYLTGAGVRDPKDQPGLIDKIIVFLLKLFSGKVLEDSKAGVNTITDTDLDWTIVRAPRLVDGPSKDDIKVGYVGEISSSLTRIDLAKFIVKQLGDDTWVQKMPAISN